MQTETRQVNRHINHVRGEVIAKNFGVKDAKGREIGGEVALTECDRTIETETMIFYYPATPVQPAGRIYGYKPHALRDGKPFGALQREQGFYTAAERDAAVAKYFASAEKRARKLAA